MITSKQKAPATVAAIREGQTPTEGIEMNITTVQQATDLRDNSERQSSEEFDGLTLIDLFRFSQRLGVEPGKIMALVPDERAPIVRAVNNVRRAAELLEEAVAAESEIGDDQADAYGESVRPHLMRVAAFLSGGAVEEVQA